MTKYDIVSTRVEEHGTGVTFTVTTTRQKTYADGTSSELVNTITAFVMIPHGEDINEYLREYVIQSGWVL